MIFALVRLMRPYYSLPLSGGLVVITAYVAGGDVCRVGVTLIPAAVALFLVISAGYILNDVCDRTVDTVNCPKRPLPMGCITPKTALLFSVILFISGMMLAGICGRRFFMALVLVALGLVFYDFYSKKMGIFKNIVAAALTVSLYPLSFALAEPVITPRLNSLYIFPVWLFLTAIGYEMLKDIRDIKGDSTLNNRRSCCTYPGFLLSARVIILAASLLTVLPYVLGQCKQIYLVCSIVAVVLAVLSSKQPPVKAIRLVYAEVFLITVGSLADLLVYGS